MICSDSTAETGLSKTDIVNRAVSLYEFIESRMREGHHLLIRDLRLAWTLVTLREAVPYL